MKRISRGEIGGGKGIRTPDLLIANETLYQLSYTPRIAGVMLTDRRRFSRRARSVIQLVGFGQRDAGGVIHAAQERGVIAGR